MSDHEEGRVGHGSADSTPDETYGGSPGPSDGSADGVGPATTDGPVDGSVSTETGADGAIAAEMDPGTAFSLLSNARRRTLVRLFSEGAEGPFDLQELSRLVAARELGVEPAELTYDQRKRVYVSLRQTHLPKLDETAVVDYDADRGTVRPNGTVETLGRLLDAAEEATSSP